MTTTVQAVLTTPAFPSHPQAAKNEEPKSRFQYLYFDLSKHFFGKVQATTCDCAAIAAKVFILALPILLFLEGLLDLAAFPFIWIANQLCREKPPAIPAPSNQPPLPNPLPPGLPIQPNNPPIPPPSQEVVPPPPEEVLLPPELVPLPPAAAEVIPPPLLEEALPYNETPPPSYFNYYVTQSMVGQFGQFAWQKIRNYWYPGGPNPAANPNPPEE